MQLQSLKLLHQTVYGENQLELVYFFLKHVSSAIVYKLLYNKMDIDDALNTCPWVDPEGESGSGPHLENNKLQYVSIKNTRSNWIP